MKKLLRTLMLAVLFLPFALMAQNTQTFDFEDNAIPAEWTNDATHPWVVTSTSEGSGHSGTYCIMSSNAGISSSTSTISATFMFVGDGSISFLAGIYGEGTSTAWDKCIFKIDGVQQFAYGALAAWNTYTFDVEAGPHTFEWTYSKDSSVDPTGDAFYLDDIVVNLGVAGGCARPSVITVGTVTGTTADISWLAGGSETSWNIYLDSVFVTAVSTPSYTFTGLHGVTTYNVAVEADCGSDVSAWRTTSFTTLVTCPAPTGLAATLTPGDGTIATLNWNENGTATAWQICLNGDTNDLIDVTDTTYDFFNLTPEQTYTAKVRAYCDFDDQSTWSNTISFTPTNAYLITVNDGTSTNGLVPVYGYWCDNTTKSQFIIPATDLANMQYGVVNKLVFYASNTNVSWGNATFDVYLTETSETTVSALADYSEMTQVYAGSLSISDHTMEITFANPYLYMGGNLMIGFLQTATGSFSSCSWYGVSATGASMGGYGSSISQQNFLPKTTIFFTPGEMPTCMPVNNLTVSNVTAHEATLAWQGEAGSYIIYDLSDTSVVATVNDTTYTLTGLASDSQHSFGVVASCGGDVSIIRTVTFTTLISCPVPTGLAVVLTPGNGTVATLNWNENGTAAAWQICLNGDETNLIDVTDTTYDFTGLTPEQAYTAKVRAICDADDHSAWSSTITFIPTDAYSVTVNEGTSTNSYVPIYGLYVDELTHSQFIIPATDIEAVQFSNIDKLTFYASQANVNWAPATFNVYLTETSETTLSELADYSTMTQVYAGSLSISGNKMEVTFTTPYHYMGGNLMIGFDQTVEGTYVSSSWYGVSATGASMGGYNTYVSQRNFLPKTTISFTPGEAPSCVPVNNLTASNVTAHEATLNWQGEAGSYIIYDLSDTSVVATVNDITYTLTGLTSESQHRFGVVADCGSDVSVMRTVSFTTLISCPVPTDLTVTYNPSDPTEVTLGWTENGTAEAWQIALNGDETNLIEANTNPYTLTGLITDSVYTAKVRAYCDADDQSVWSGTISFEPTTKTVIGSGDATNDYLPTYTYYNYSLTQQIYTSAEMGDAGLIESIDFYNTGNVRTRELSIYMVSTTKDTFNNSTDWVSVTAADLQYSGSVTFESQAWTTIELDGFAYDGTSNVAIIVDDNTGSYQSGVPFLVFNATKQAIRVYNDETNYDVTDATYNGTVMDVKNQIRLGKSELSGCMKPTGVTVNYTGGQTAEVSWTSDAQSFNISVNGTEINNVTNPYTLTGLSYSTTYQVRVQAICDASSISNWTMPVSFTTECGPVDVYPYVQDFSAVPGCWAAIDADGDGYNWELYGGAIQSASYDNNAGALTPDNWLISPQFAIPATGSYEVTWSATAQDQSWPAEHYGVFISTTGGNDTANFTMIQEWTLTAGVFNPVINLSSYAGQNIYIALRHFNCTDQFRLSIDNFTVRAQAGADQVTINVGQNNPAYGTVTGEGIYNIGDNVTVTATPASGYIFSKWVDETNTLVSTDNPYTFVAATDLTLNAIFLNSAGTTYTITVEVNDSLMGTATGGGTFTAGEQITLTATANAGYHFVNWTQISSFGENEVGTETTLLVTVTGDKTFRANFESDTPGTESLTIHLTSNNPALGSITPAPGTYHVALNDSLVVSATPNAGVDFDGWRIMIGGQTLATVPVNPFTLPVNSNNITFGEITLMAMFSDSTSVPDSITVIVNTADATMGTTNPAPGTYHYAVGSQSYLAAIPNAGYHNLYWIEQFEIAGISEYDTLYADTVHLTVLPIMAGVVLHITAYFEANSASCETPTNLHASEFTDNSITIGWNANGNATSWNIRYGAEGGEWQNATATTNTYVINGLQPATVYEIKVQADCGNGEVSDWSEPIHICTSGLDSWLKNSVKLYPNPAKDYVDIRIDGDVNVTMMEVYDVYGKLINTVNVMENTTRINVNGLANGMYFVRVTTDNGVVTKPFVKK